MVLTPRKLIKLKSFKLQICEKVYGRHPAVGMSCFKKMPFGRSLYTVHCYFCGQLRLMDEEHLKELVDNYREKGNIGFLTSGDVPRNEP